MKKKLFFLILLLGITLLKTTNVYAENINFYEAEYIDNIYMNKYEYQSNTIYYQKARFFRKTDTNEFAYCIEPFTFFQENSSYTANHNMENISQDKIDIIKKIAHFGYGYKDHTDSKWYAITQLLIWKEIGSEQGRFYFTDTLNGNEINPFEKEIQEIETLIKEYNTQPIANNTTYTVLENKSIGIFVGNTINDYQSNSENITIKDGTIGIKNLQEGEYNFLLTRIEEHNNPFLFYQSNNSQTLINVGDLDNKIITLKIKVEKSSIIIHKIDYDYQNTTPQGEASLNGAIYGLYQESNNKLICTTEINNNIGIFDNPDYGYYYIKEISPGEGYTLDDNIYKTNIEFKDYQKEITLENKVIEKEIKIIKKYGEINNLLGENNIQFEIYNQNNELFKTIITNENGEAYFTLPYGTYTLKQMNTTEGYEKAETRIIIVKDNIEETIELIDYKIPVPNTYTRKTILQLILKWLYSLIC